MRARRVPEGAGPAAVLRGLGFLALWAVLAGADPADLPGAVMAVVPAVWVSLLLVPPVRWRLAPLGVLHLVLRFPFQSLAAGSAIAWRALRPDPGLSPGFVRFAQRLPPGTARDAFCCYASLVPGTLPAGTDGEVLEVHSLEAGPPVAVGLAREEGLFLRAMGGGRGDG
jgi:multicomponent Na+:H+ antiporter subunit E